MFLVFNACRCLVPGRAPKSKPTRTAAAICLNQAGSWHSPVDLCNLDMIRLVGRRVQLEQKIVLLGFASFCGFD
jgi:hypothetical protein